MTRPAKKPLSWQPLRSATKGTRVDMLAKETLERVKARGTHAFNVYRANGGFVGGFDCILKAREVMKREKPGAIITDAHGVVLSVRTPPLQVFPDLCAGRPYGADVGMGD